MNERIKLEVKLEGGVECPQYQTEGAAAFDIAPNKILKAYKGESETDGDKLQRMQESFLRQGYIKMRPFERILFGTGIFMQIPDDYEIQVRPRSGNSLKKGLAISNSPGTVDEDYTGEIGIIITNNNPFLCQVDINQRLAQCSLKKVYRADIQVVEEITKVTKRGSDGYGSTNESE